MGTAKSISILHVIFFSMTVIGLENHVTIIPPLLRQAGRDSWLSVLIATLIMSFWLLLWLYVQNNSNDLAIKDWLQESIGKVGAWVFLLFFSFWLLLLAAATMRQTLQWMNETFLPETPITIMLLIFFVLCILLIVTDLQTMAIVNTFVLFGVVTFGFFVAFTNLQVKDYGLLRPFLEFGPARVFKGVAYPASGFVEILTLLFIQHKVKKRMKMKHLLVILFISTGLTLGPLLGAIVEFGPDEATKQRYPAYEEWGLVTIGRFIEHVDFFSIYQWLTGAFIRIGLFLYIITDIFNIAGNSKKIWKYVAPIFFLTTVGFFLIGDDQYIILEAQFLIANTYLFSAILIVLAIIAAFSKRKQKNPPKKKVSEDAISE